MEALDAKPSPAEYEVRGSRRPTDARKGRHDLRAVDDIYRMRMRFLQIELSLMIPPAASSTNIQSGMTHVRL